MFGRGLIELGQLKVSRRQPAKWFTIDTIEQLVSRGRQQSHGCRRGRHTGSAAAVSALSLAIRGFHR
jgi:hypothetical protein